MSPVWIRVTSPDPPVVVVVPPASAAAGIMLAAASPITAHSALMRVLWALDCLTSPSLALCFFICFPPPLRLSNPRTGFVPMETTHKHGLFPLLSKRYELTIQKRVGRK